MLKFFGVCFLVFVFIAIFCFVTRNYVNPYKLIFVFGKKGSGKSTLLTKLAIKYSRKSGLSGLLKIFPAHIILMILS